MTKKQTIKEIEEKAKDYFGDDFKKQTYFENFDYNSEIRFIDDLDIGFYLIDLQTGSDYFIELRTSLSKKETNSDLFCGLILDHDLQVCENNWDEFIEFIFECKEQVDDFKKALLTNF